MFHILVVDDDKNTRRLMRAVLEAERYTVSTAENGEKALEVMDAEHIDLVVLDIMMPKMDGYEFTKVLRYVQNDLPIFMVSAKQLPADRKQGFLVSIDDFILHNRFRRLPRRHSLFNPPPQRVSASLYSLRPKRWKMRAKKLPGSRKCRVMSNLIMYASDTRIPNK